jgi:hypothetical protein
MRIECWVLVSCAVDTPCWAARAQCQGVSSQSNEHLHALLPGLLAACVPQYADMQQQTTLQNDQGHADHVLVMPTAGRAETGRNKNGGAADAGDLHSSDVHLQCRQERGAGQSTQAIKHTHSMLHDMWRAAGTMGMLGK